MNWDYSPAREYTAFIYPAFEYSLLLYLVLDFVNTAIAYQRGYVSASFWQFSRIVFPIMIVLTALFRMIFVIVAYENVGGKTGGFLGLQVALILLAIHNTLFVLEAGISYDLVGGLRNTKIIAETYLLCNMLIGSIKLFLTGRVVFKATPFPWSHQQSGVPGHNIAELVDRVWMVCKALLPLFISFVRARSEKPLLISVGLRTPAVILLSQQQQQQQQQSDNHTRGSDESSDNDHDGTLASRRRRKNKKKRQDDNDDDDDDTVPPSMFDGIWIRPRFGATTLLSSWTEYGAGFMSQQSFQHFPHQQQQRHPPQYPQQHDSSHHRLT